MTNKRTIMQRGIMSRDAEIYWQEFDLNITNQYPKIKEIMSVSYVIVNCLVGSILLPRGSCWL